MTAPADDLGVEYYDDVAAGKVEEQPKEEKSFLRKAGEAAMGPILGTEEGRRHVARTGARIEETLTGLPGDIKELFNSIAIGIPEYFAGEELPRWRQAVEGPPPGTFVGGFGLGEPTSRDLREGLKEAVGSDYLEPQNKWEEFGDAVAEDFAALAIPVKGKIPFARALGTSIMANSGGEVAKAFGGEKAGAVTKLGLLFAGGMLGHGQGGVKQHIRKLYKDMEGSISQGAEVNAKGLASKLEKIEGVLRKGDPLDASKQPAFQKLKAIRDKISGGNIAVEELVELNKSTNEAIFGLGELKRGQHQLYNVRNAIHETLGEYGSQNADFLGKWKMANEAYAATEASRKVSNWVRKNVKPKDYLYAAGALGIEGGYFGAPATVATIGTGAALGATAYSAEVMKRIATSPALRKYYQNVVTHSLNQNKVGFMRAMKQLDNGLKSSLEKEPFETVEFED